MVASSSAPGEYFRRRRHRREGRARWDKLRLVAKLTTNVYLDNDRVPVHADTLMPIKKTAFAAWPR